MKNNLIKENTKCKTCYKPLSDENKSIGYCDECAIKEIAKLKKRILISFVMSIAIIIFAIAIRSYACATYFAGTHGEVLVSTAFGNLMFNPKSFNRVLYLSMTSGIIFIAICFFAPFSSFVHIEYNTYGYKAEQQLYKTDPFGAQLNASTNKQRTDDAGLFIASLLLSAVSGPYYFVYRLYKLRQLSKHISRVSTDSNSL